MEYEFGYKHTSNSIMKSKRKLNCGESENGCTSNRCRQRLYPNKDFIKNAFDKYRPISTRQGLAIRGHKESEGNLVQLL